MVRVCVIFMRRMWELIILVMMVCHHRYLSIPHSLGTHAFYNILKRKSKTYSYGNLLVALSADLEKKRYKDIKRRCGKLVKENLTNMMRDIKY